MLITFYIQKKYEYKKWKGIKYNDIQNAAMERQCDKH